MKRWYNRKQMCIRDRQHFVNYGMAEGRQGRASFNVYTYRDEHPELWEKFGDNLRGYYLWACCLLYTSINARSRRQSGIRNLKLAIRAIPHNSKCRYGERGAADAKPKAQIILDAAKVDVYKRQL